MDNNTKQPLQDDNNKAAHIHTATNETDTISVAQHAPSVPVLELERTDQKISASNSVSVDEEVPNKLLGDNNTECHE